MQVTPFSAKAKEEKKLTAWEQFEKEWLSEPIPRVKPKPKPKVQVTAELSPKVAEAVKANPASLQVRLSAEADGTAVVERPRRVRVEVIEAREGQAVLARQYDSQTNEWSTIEYEGGYRKSGVVSDYNPLDALKRGDE